MTFKSNFNNNLFMVENVLFALDYRSALWVARPQLMLDSASSEPPTSVVAG